MISNISSTAPPPHPPQPYPTVNGDGTISAVVLEMRPFATGGQILLLWLPLALDAGAGFGRYFLVRCVEDHEAARAAEWSIYARRPIFCTALPTARPEGIGSAWEFLIPNEADDGYQWLVRRTAGSSINLLGPLGQPFTLATTTRALLVITDTDRLPLTLPIIHTMLDLGGRVLLIVKGEADTTTSWLPRIPIPVETRTVPPATWLEQLEQPVRWADQLCAALSPHDYAPLANAVRTIRFRLDADFAHVLYPGDLICGVGACLACVVPTRDGGYTRACVNGPIFPLTTLA